MSYLAYPNKSGYPFNINDWFGRLSDLETQSDVVNDPIEQEVVERSLFYYLRAFTHRATILTNVDEYEVGTASHVFDNDRPKSSCISKVII